MARKREYPKGRVGPTDDGAMRIAVGVVESHKIIKMDFETPTLWFAMGLEEAEALRDVLDKHIGELRELLKKEGESGG